MIIIIQHLLDKFKGEIVTIAPDSSVQDAIEIMAEKTISALPVMADDRVIGIISERDYIRKAAPNKLLPWEIKVEDIMTVDVISTTCTETVHNCMKTMSENRIRHLPVIENEQLIGIISITDVIRALQSFRSTTKSEAEAYSE